MAFCIKHLKSFKDAIKQSGTQTAVGSDPVVISYIALSVHFIFECVLHGAVTKTLNRKKKSIRKKKNVSYCLK